MEPLQLIILIIVSVIFGALVAGYGLAALSRNSNEPRFTHRRTNLDHHTLKLSHKGYNDIQVVFYDPAVPRAKEEMFQRYEKWLGIQSGVDGVLKAADADRVEAKRVLRDAHEHADTELADAEDAIETAKNLADEIRSDAQTDATKIKSDAKANAKKVLEKAEQRGPEVEEGISERIVLLTNVGKDVKEKQEEVDGLVSKIKSSKEELKELNKKLRYRRGDFENHDQPIDESKRLRTRWLVAATADNMEWAKVFHEHLPQFRITRALEGFWVLDTLDELPMTFNEFREKHIDELRSVSGRILFMELPKADNVKMTGWLTESWPSINSAIRPFIA